jgi:nucleoside-diphosphate-sugar epimerase
MVSEGRVRCAVRIFVLGATGHLGQAVVRHALARGRAVTAATRQADPRAMRGLDVTTVRVDNALNGLNDLAAGHDVMVDAAAPYPLEPCLPASPPWRAAIDGAVLHARKAIEAARRNRMRLVFISSYTTLSRTESPLDAIESAWRRSAYPYFAAKIAMEQSVLAAAGEGLPAVVVNPAACLGPWEFRGEQSSLVRLVMSRKLPVVMDRMLSVIDVRDVAEAIDNSLEREFFGRPIALAGHNVSLADLARQIARHNGDEGALPAAIDPRLASFAAFWSSAALAACGQRSPDVLRAVPLAADGFPMRPSPEQIAMGLDLHPLSATLDDAIAFHRGLQVV